MREEAFATLRTAALAAVVSTFCSSTARADPVVDALGTLGPEPYLCLWFTGSDRAESMSLERCLRSDAWAAATRAAKTVCLSVDASPSLRQRFSLRRLPTCVVLRASGEEVGRFHLDAELQQTAATLRGVLQAAENSSELGAPKTNYWLGRLHHQRGEYFKAGAALRRFVSRGDSLTGTSLAPRRAHALQLLGRHAIESGRDLNADRLLTQAREAIGADGERDTAIAISLDHARTLRRQGQTEAAAARLEAECAKALPEGARREQLFWTLGYFYLELGDRARARRAFRSAAANGLSQFGSRARLVLQCAELSTPAGNSEHDDEPEGDRGDDADPGAHSHPGGDSHPRGRDGFSSRGGEASVAAVRP